MSPKSIDEVFSEKVVLLRDQLVAAQVCLDIWSHLMDRTEELARGLDRYRGFFVPTILAHQTLFFIKMTIATDAKDVRQPSVYEVLRIVEEVPSLAPSLNVASIRARLSPLADVMRRVRRARDRRFAHVDTTKKPPRVELGEYRRLLEELKDCFWVISAAYGITGEPFVFNPAQGQHTSELLMMLQQQNRSSDD